MTSKKEEPKKPYRLPAIGRPKKKVEKSSVREMGARASKNYAFGNTKAGVILLKSNGWLNDIYDATDREVAREQALVWKKERENAAKGKKVQSKGKVKLTEARTDQQARNTGMAKGGLAVKRKPKKKQ